MKRNLSLILAFIIAFSAAVFASGCSNNSNKSSQSSQSSQSSADSGTSAKDLLDGVELYNSEGIIEDSEVHPYYNDFSAKLLQQCSKDGENLLVSPISVAYAITMAANGADGETLSQIEKTLGKDLYTLNRYLYFAMEGEYSGDPTKQSRANSLWINSEVNYKPDNQYLADVRTFYDGNLFYTDFENADKEISAWLSKKSGGKLTDSVTPVSKDDTMTLVNSLFFDAQWANPVDSKNTKSDTFTCADGTKKQLDYMSSIGDLYINDGKATGFIKRYKGANYGFMAIIPNEGVSVEAYIKELTGEKLTSLMKDAKAENVEISMPKFEQSDGLSLKAALNNLGIKDAFDKKNANFSKMGKADKNLSLLDEVNSEYVSIDENGINHTGTAATKAANAAKSDKKVVLNRPFIYMIIDGSASTTKLIGVYNK